MSTETKIDVKALRALRALLAKATKGPWTHNGHGTIRHHAAIAWCGAASSWSATEENESITDAGATRNADLIAAAVNALPALLDLADAVLDLAPMLRNARYDTAEDAAAARRVLAILESK